MASRTRSLIGLFVVAFSVSGIAVVSAASDNPADPQTGKSVTYESELHLKINELNQAIEDRYLEADRLDLLPKNPANEELVTQNADEIRSLKEQLEAIAPTTPGAYVPDAIRAKMEDAQMRLIYSGFPVYAIGITSETGKLNVKVDVTRATDIDDEIQKFVGDGVPLEVEYGTNTFKFQASNYLSDHATR